MSTHHSENRTADAPTGGPSTSTPVRSPPDSSMGRWHPQDYSGTSTADASPAPRRSNPTELQQAIDALVTRIAAARANGAAQRDATEERTESPEGQPMRATVQEAIVEPDSAGTDNQPPSPRPARLSGENREVVELETRLRQIADLAGPSLVADIGADIAALRGEIGNLTRAGGILSDRTGAIQAELLQLRQTVTQVSPPVADRFAALDHRLDQIAKNLANRQLTPEAQAAVEHSCSHILDSIANLERVAQQTTPPQGIWDEIAVASRTLARLPTVENFAALENNIQSVSGQLGEMAAQNQTPSDFARLDRRLSDLAIATASTAAEIRRRPVIDPTKVHADLAALAEEIRRRPMVDTAKINADLAALAEEIRRRPSADPARINADLEALADKIDQWREQVGNVGDVGAKLDEIGRRVDDLTKLDYAPVLWKIMEGLTTLAESSADGRTSGLHADLGVVLERLAAAGQGPASASGDMDAEPQPAPANRTALASDGSDAANQVDGAGNAPLAKPDGGDAAPESGTGGADFIGGPNDDDHEVAKRLATRFAPLETFAPTPSDKRPTRSPHVSDLTAFQAVKDALEALGPMIKSRSETENREGRLAGKHAETASGRTMTSAHHSGAAPESAAVAGRSSDAPSEEPVSEPRSEDPASEDDHAQDRQPTGGWSGTVHATQQARGPSPWRPATVAVLEAKRSGY